MNNDLFRDFQDRFADYQKQMLAWQKQFLIPFTFPPETPPIPTSANIEEILAYQEKLVGQFLDAQLESQQAFVNAQKQFWHDYFEALRRATPQPTASSTT